MGKLRFRIAGVDFEYEADPIEIQRLVQQLLGQAGQFVPSQTKLTVKPTETLTQSTRSQIKLSKEGMLDYPLKPDEDIIKYIVKKPSFSQPYSFRKNVSCRALCP